MHTMSLSIFQSLAMGSLEAIAIVGEFRTHLSKSRLESVPIVKVLLQYWRISNYIILFQITISTVALHY